MKQTALLTGIAADLRALADKVELLTDKPETAEPCPPPAQLPKLEEVRAVLAEISRADKREQVQALLREFGADRLSAIDPAQFPALLEKAEALK